MMPAMRRPSSPGIASAPGAGPGPGHPPLRRQAGLAPQTPTAAMPPSPTASQPQAPQPPQPVPGQITFPQPSPAQLAEPQMDTPMRADTNPMMSGQMPDPSGTLEHLLQMLRQ